MKNTVSTVKETPYGIYVWKMPNGAIVQDEDGNIMSINAKEHDLRAMSALTNVARSYGLVEGGPWFLPNYRKVSDEEYDKQKERLAQGLIPDELDLGAWRDEEKFRAQK